MNTLFVWKPVILAMSFPSMFYVKKGSKEEMVRCSYAAKFLIIRVIRRVY